jgi:ribonuclease HI
MPTGSQQNHLAMGLNENQQSDHSSQTLLGMNSVHAGNPSQQMNRYTVHMPALLPGVRCYVDASTLPDNPTMSNRKAGLGILFVNTQVQPAQTIFIKAQFTASQSVLMAEAAALAIAATLNDSLHFDSTTFLSDSQQLVHFLNQQDQSHPPDWRIKFLTQSFTNYSVRRRATILKISRNLSATADGLARQAFF